MTKTARLLTVILLCMTGISAFAQNSTERQDLLEEIEKDLTENILPFWMEKSGDNYSDALFTIKGKEVSVGSSSRKINLKFDRRIKAFTRKEGEGTTVFITLMPSLRKGRKAELSAVMKTGHISLEE